MLTPIAGIPCHEKIKNVSEIWISETKLLSVELEVWCRVSSHEIQVAKYVLSNASYMLQDKSC